jgi:hypothetical protein
VLATGVAAAIVLVSAVPHARWLGAVAVAALLAVIFLKGTSPGGSAEWHEFQAARPPRAPRIR